jgi:hypothetical protein
MVDPAVKEQLAEMTSPEEEQSLMLQWADTPDSSLFASATNKRERLQMMDGFYRHLKEAVFQVLQTEQGIRIRDLPSAGQAIVTGPAVKLEKLVRSGGVLERDQKVQVLPNVMFHALQRG